MPQMSSNFANVLLGAELHAEYTAIERTESSLFPIQLIAGRPILGAGERLGTANR